jgi:crotonobetainyl-CoA:carnitine CoA-transferase CaiB-like acyl-CoA transferase
MFKDLLVIETAGVLAGPSVGMFFAELGARVVKVENKRAGGDVTRQWKLTHEDPASPVSAYFSSVNWGKEHLFLDLKDSEDRERFDSLVSKADVLITNHLAADEEKLGLTNTQAQPTAASWPYQGFRRPTAPTGLRRGAAGRDRLYQHDRY